MDRTSEVGTPSAQETSHVQDIVEHEEIEDQVDAARKVAYIIGPGSGAARALARYDELKAAGHPTHVILRNGWWLVKEPS